MEDSPFVGATDDFEVIELIQPDHELFGDAAPDSRPERPALHRRRGFVPLAVAAGLAVAGAVALVVWQPWVEAPPVLWLPTDPPDPLTLTDRLVIDGWTADADERRSDPGERIVLLGHLFAEAKSLTAIETGRFAAVQLMPPTPFTPSVSETGTQIQGAPASVDIDGDGMVQIGFGPVADRNYVIITRGFTSEEAVALAEVVRIDERGTRIGDSTRLLDLEPRVSVQANQLVRSVIHAATAADSSAEINVVAYRGRFPVTLATSPATTATEQLLAAASFNLDSAESTTVRGMPAVVGRHSTSTLDIVVWVEGGRVVALAAQPGRGLDVVELAERVRPATDDEWAAVTG